MNKKLFNNQELSIINYALETLIEKMKQYLNELKEELLFEENREEKDEETITDYKESIIDRQEELYHIIKLKSEILECINTKE